MLSCSNLLRCVWHFHVCGVDLPVPHVLCSNKVPNLSYKVSPAPLPPCIVLVLLLYYCNTAMLHSTMLHVSCLGDAVPRHC